MSGVNITFSVHPGADLKIGTFYSQIDAYWDKMADTFGENNIEHVVFNRSTQFMIEVKSEAIFTLFMMKYPPSQYQLVIAGVCIEESAGVNV